MPSNLRLVRIPSLVVLACLALVALAVAETGAAASPTVRATRACAPTKKEPHYLPDDSGYFTSNIKLTKVTCTYARKFIVAYWRCRTNSGKNPAHRGCSRKVQKFSCTERKGQSIPTQFNATVTCRRGGTQRIVHSYQQNLGE